MPRSRLHPRRKASSAPKAAPGSWRRVIRAFTLRNFSPTKPELVPAGIFVTGASHDLTCRRSFILFAVWTVPVVEMASYVLPLVQAHQLYKPHGNGSETVWAGDFNASVLFDTPSRRYKFRDFVDVHGASRQDIGFSRTGKAAAVNAYGPAQLPATAWTWARLSFELRIVRRKRIFATSGETIGGANRRSS